MGCGGGCSGGGGFRVNPNLQNRFTQQNLRKFGKTIQDDETISDVTKKELAEEIAKQGEGNLGQAASESARIRGIFAQAQQGVGKFAGRQIQSKQRSLLRDRPGRSQTILSR